MVINENGTNISYINVYDLHTKTVHLPIFQRGYSWKPEQAHKILENIENLLENGTKDRQIYLLDFIGFEENGDFKLADGQQRLITIALLTRCVIEYIKKQNLIPIIEDYPVIYDDEVYEKIWKRFKDGQISAPFKKVYLYFEDFVTLHGKDVRQIESILINNMFVYLKMAENADDAFDIFEQINTGGKPLSKDEIIRTITKQYSDKYSVDLNTKNKELKEMLVSYHKFLEYSGGNGEKGAFNSFAIMSFLNREVVKDKAAFLKFKKYIEATKSVESLDITCIARTLNRKQLMDMIYAYEATGTNLRVNRKPVNEVLMPLFLLCSVFTLKGVNPAGRIKDFLDGMVLNVINGLSTDAIAKKIAEFVSKNTDVSVVTLDEFTGLLKGRNKQNILKALLLMDIVRSNTSGSFTPERINLEHIYPQKPDVFWSTKGYPVTEEEQEEIIYDIGNFLILNEAVNKKVKNKYISDKKVEYDRIIPNDKILQTTTNTVDFVRYENEGKSYIEERRKDIADFIRNNYPFGKTFITP